MSSALYCYINAKNENGQILLVLILFESVELIPFADVCSEMNV